MKGVKIDWTPAMDARLAEAFPTRFNGELAAELGVSETALHRRARALGLKKDPDFRAVHAKELSRRIRAGQKRSGKRFGLFKPGEHRGLAYEFKPGCKPDPEMVARRTAKAAATRRKILAEERLRFKWGLEQKTRLRVCAQPREKSFQRCYLRKLGYIVARGSDTVYYTEDTRRSPKLEGRKYGDKHYFYFDFKPLDKWQ